MHVDAVLCMLMLCYAFCMKGAGLKWVDNKKPIFKVSLKAISCLYVPVSKCFTVRSIAGLELFHREKHCWLRAVSP